MSTPSTSRAARCTIVFAGGGSGGHIFPNLAVIERLREMALDFTPHLIISPRPVDAQIVATAQLAATPIPAQPFTPKPWRWPSWYAAWRRSVADVKTVLYRHQVKCLIATGGFVSAPALTAARALDIPNALVSLDAVPGKANRLMARKAGRIFSAYPVPDWPNAQVIDAPLRRAAVGPADHVVAKRQLGLDPARPMLAVFGGSQGAGTLNRLLIQLAATPDLRAVLTGHAPPQRPTIGINDFAGKFDDTPQVWQIFHAAGADDVAAVRAAYAQAGLIAHVVPFCDRMDLAWSAADLAISRAGASSVAEAWANATPTVFLPYPFHKDEHQRLNAQPLADLGGAVIYRDLVDPVANAHQLTGPLISLLSNGVWRKTMADAMRLRPPSDGAAAIAQWIAQAVVGTATRPTT
ncbi:MAG: glycosyltransferase [Phycisphaeraceae bacterium]|nr:glycosyltransferase [Phycisphaeraceae bacterium]